ncbi:MAG: solute-binding protein [Proteobacteria bacterium]|nr:solute-binding protein [Pseudomonadota bacterium]
MVRKSISPMLVGVLLLLAVSNPAMGKERKYNDIYGNGKSPLVVATGSPGALGLLKALSEPFCRRNDCRIQWLKKGSGASLKALKSGIVDLVMVHAPSAEKKAVGEGWATMRTLLGSNEFYIVGPPADPAGIRTAKSAADAFAGIARTRSRFFSRGDNSGTHKKELMIWKRAGTSPSGSWYRTSNDFMGPTLMLADGSNGYFMTDSSTFFVKKSKLKRLKILFRGDPILVNTYHALIASPDRFPSKNHRLAGKFVAFVGSAEGQRIYREFGRKKYGTALYNDAEYAAQWDH